MTGTDFHPLPPDALSHLERQRAFVRDLVRHRFPGKALTGGAEDLEILQAIVDQRLIAPDRTWELQSLGVAFGDILARRIDGLAWCEVTDEFGTDPTLRYRLTSFNVNALTMISKRVESGRAVDLEYLVAQIALTLANVPNA